ncbi:hypothetical protein [Mucilaginibacter galii]|nr:hypothetical protein [Mucilaginibacter galii]
MKTLIAILFLTFTVSGAIAQGFSYPALHKSVNSVKDIVPANWKIKSVANGDLNGDGVADAAVVIEYAKAIKERRPDGVMNTGHPRILAILFKVGNGYRLTLQNNTIILRDGEVGMVNDAFDQIFIAKRVLNINYEFVREHSYYKYRYQQGDFYLIGATLTGVSGNKMEDNDYNFSTRKAVFNSGTIDGEETKVEHKRIKINKLNSLREAEIPHDWPVQ